MLVYGDNEHNVCGWNTVNVLVDGLLQHGRVINIVDTGLIVDFGCATQCAQFVASGRIFHSEYFDNRPDAGDDAVQVLLRPHPTAPWTWYPGKILALGGYSTRDCDAHFVEVTLPYGTIRELLPCFQVRRPPTDAEYQEGRVEKNDFLIRCCPLPAAYWSDGVPAVHERFQAGLSRRYDVLCTVVLSQALLYLQCKLDTPLTIQQVEDVYGEAKNGTPEICSAGLWSPMINASILKGRFSCLYEDVEIPRPSPPLAIHLWVEIFQTLDSIERVRCRRVCPLWNTLLTTDVYFPDVRVSGSLISAYGDVGLSDYEQQQHPVRTGWSTVC
ncbi:uncharacterized protein LOC129596581 [Paramacrobiotus metropolitanus]|uniref:uncharacterized protein LOC129596581 n=1 Tax=Paramacrobiotus metropolitanus TaxID=2943436 RepID=UPI00244593F8|nr:uncharacterized protein LOC129596581 [Paramacrobiotus metropolitanus]